MGTKDIFFFTEWEARNIITTLETMIQIFGFVDVQTYYDISGESWGPTDKQWGWTDISGNSISYDSETGRYHICLPRPMKL